MDSIRFLFIPIALNFFHLPLRGGTQYEFKKLPFGFSESPAEFQKRVYDIFKDLVRSNKVQIYIDDILIATNDIEENLEILVLILLKKYRLDLNLAKCSFLKTEIEYLGIFSDGRENYSQ